VHRYIIRRLILMIPMLLGISAISFFVMQLAPGDFLDEMKLNPQISHETYLELRAAYGLDRPLWQQYLLWLSNAVRGNLGLSLTYNMPVLDVIGSRAWNTLVLATASTAFAWLVAIPVGIYAAVRQYSLLDRILTACSYIGLSIPNFFLALCLLLLVVHFNIDLPIGGATSVEYPWLSLGEKIVDRIRHLLLPMLVLSTGQMAGLLRYMRSSLLDTLRRDYVMTARAKGLSEKTVILRHACRNALNPLITLFGFELGGLLSGAAITESVTGWPGLGKVILGAVQARDYYLAMGSLMIGSALLILGNLVADVLLALSDPRIRYE
jgi:peptide/nickel transport system permease protein